MALSQSAINVVKATAPVVAEHALQITSAFYRTMFTNNPEVQAFFNKAHQRGSRQPRALADSVVQYAVNIENLGALGPLVSKIAHRHCALSVKPEHYGIVHSNLMLAIGEVLGSAVTPEIGKGWSDAVLALAGICIDAEEAIYKQAEVRAKRSIQLFASTPPTHPPTHLLAIASLPPPGRQPHHTSHRAANTATTVYAHPFFSCHPPPTNNTTRPRSAAGATSASSWWPRRRSWRRTP